MTDEEKADAVLKALLKLKKNFVSDTVVSEQLKDILSYKEVSILLRELKTKDYVIEGSNGFMISASGEMLLKNNGYVGRKQREDKLFRFTIRTFWWVVVGSIAATATLLFVIYEHFCKSN